MPEQELLVVILDEVRAIRIENSDFRERIKALETELHPIIGNGQPGRLTVAEKKINDLYSYLWRALGAIGALSASGGFIWALVKFGIQQP
jgi:hypothetical protein